MVISHRHHQLTQVTFKTKRLIAIKSEKRFIFVKIPLMQKKMKNIRENQAQNKIDNNATHH